MIRQKPLVPRSELNSRSIELQLPNFVSYEDRSADSYSFSGAYMLCSGWMTEENEPYETVNYPSEALISNQLKYHNSNLTCPVKLVLEDFSNDCLLLCDVFAAGIRSAESDCRWTLARRLFDMALTASEKNWKQMPQRVEAALQAIEEASCGVEE